MASAIRTTARALVGLLVIAPALPALAADAAAPVVTYAADGAFDDVTFAVESAILDRGLVIDSVSHVGEMLNRTAADVGATKDLFVGADVFLFCSAVISRRVMEVDPDNIAYCPYGVFVRQMAGGEQVEVGYRRYPPGPMAEVEALLDAIAREAAGLD